MITREHVLTANWSALYDVVAAMREARGPAHLKAILATGDMQTLRTVYSASTGAVSAKVSQGSGADIDMAVKAARAAQGKWAALPGHARAMHLYALARHLQQHARFLAALETIGNGKPIRESRDIDLPKGVLNIVAGDGATGAGLTGHPGIDKVAFSGSREVGRQIRRQLAGSGKALTLAVSDLSQAFETSDLPAGVINIVTGPRAALANTLAEHDDVDALWYFGTRAGGAAVSSGNLKQTW